MYSKRQRSGEDQPNGQLVPQAKRPSRAHPLSPETGRDACDPESSNSESSGISSPEHLVGSCSSQFSAADPLAGQRVVPGCCSPLVDSSSSSSGSASSSSSELLLSYHQINRILREAHFQSLHSRGQHTDT
ncbi:hypothetical protein CRUP_037787 [Coryphaenoides rupestris]|nr:hypothetical protein CRUP_037787 [Coryphaenoides rupestris]